MLRVGSEGLCQQPMNRNLLRKNPMKPETTSKNPKQMNSQPSKTDEVNTQKQKAEVKEVAGRHKNDGQKDHKGAR